MVWKWCNMLLPQCMLQLCLYCLTTLSGPQLFIFSWRKCIIPVINVCTKKGVAGLFRLLPEIQEQPTMTHPASSVLQLILSLQSCVFLNQERNCAWNVLFQCWYAAITGGWKVKQPVMERLVDHCHKCSWWSRYLSYWWCLLHENQNATLSQTEYFPLLFEIHLWKMQWQRQHKAAFDSCLIVPLFSYVSSLIRPNTCEHLKDRSTRMMLKRMYKKHCMISSTGYWKDQPQVSRQR